MNTSPASKQQKDQQVHQTCQEDQHPNKTIQNHQSSGLWHREVRVYASDCVVFRFQKGFILASLQLTTVTSLDLSSNPFTPSWYLVGVRKVKWNRLPVWSYHSSSTDLCGGKCKGGLLLCALLEL